MPIKVDGTKVIIVTNLQRTSINCAKPEIVGRIISILHSRIAKQEDELTHVYNRLQEAHDED